MVESAQRKSRQLAELRAALQRNMREAEVLQWKIGQLVAEEAEDHQHVEPGFGVECNYSIAYDSNLQEGSSQDVICLPGSPTTCPAENLCPEAQDLVKVVKVQRDGRREKLDVLQFIPKSVAGTVSSMF